jgi:hypothetical protein
MPSALESKDIAGDADGNQQRVALVNILQALSAILDETGELVGGTDDEPNEGGNATRVRRADDHGADVLELNVTRRVETAVFAALLPSMAGREPGFGCPQDSVRIPDALFATLQSAARAPSPYYRGEETDLREWLAGFAKVREGDGAVETELAAVAAEMGDLGAMRAVAAAVLRSDALSFLEAVVDDKGRATFYGPEARVGELAAE